VNCVLNYMSISRQYTLPESTYLTLFGPLRIILRILSLGSAMFVQRRQVRPNKKKYLVSVTLSQIFRGGRAGFFFNFYSFLNFLIVFFGGWGRFSHHIGDIFCTDVAKAAILL
jgi:hypothetical protein